MLADNEVAVYEHKGARYSNNPPYNPPDSYPEYQLEAGPDPTNEAYHLIRESFLLLGLDRKNYGKPEWNPLGHLIRPGETVLLKPNLIAHSQMYTDEWEHVITHDSLMNQIPVIITPPASLPCHKRCWPNLPHRSSGVTRK